MLYLVRHADAGNRGAWTGDDFERPLDDHGQMQAEAIGAALADRPVRRILSSPYVRCMDTVVPLGRALGLAVEASDELTEGAYVGDALDLLGSLAKTEGDSVLCSHGDVIPGVLWVLAQHGRAGHRRSGPVQEGIDLGTRGGRRHDRRRRLPPPQQLRRGLRGRANRRARKACRSEAVARAARERSEQERE